MILFTKYGIFTMDMMGMVEKKPRKIYIQERKQGKIPRLTCRLILFRCSVYKEGKRP